MAKPFPSDFYVVCATVIPVLFLALVVQGGTYEAMLNAARNAARALPRRTWNYVLARFLPWVAYLAVAGALGGELLSLLALFSGSDTYQPRLVVLITTISLMGVVAAAPAWRWWQVRRAVARQRLRPVVGLPGSPQFGFGARLRPLWTARDLAAEQIRAILRDAGCPEFGRMRDGFVVEGGEEGEPFLVACTVSHDARAARQMAIYEDALSAAGYRVVPFPADERGLQIWTVKVNGPSEGEAGQASAAL